MSGDGARQEIKPETDRGAMWCGRQGPREERNPRLSRDGWGLLRGGISTGAQR
jgi:hypothetical protein